MIGVIISAFLGFAGVLQGGLNRIMMKKMSLAETSVVNNTLVLIFALTFLLITKFYSQDSNSTRELINKLEWWHILPGILGFYIVTGLPYAMSQYGALKVFIIIIGAQVIASILWDIVIEKIPITSPKIIATCLALSSMLVLNLGKK